MQVDYIIVGQGLCGSWLSYYLTKAGASVLVVDGGRPGAASAAASGIINPITGKRLARQWMGETLLPFAERAYAEISAELSTQPALTVPIQVFFSTAEEARFFEQKAATTHTDLLSFDGHPAAGAHFNYHYGTGSIYPAMLVDVPRFLALRRRRLAAQGALLEEEFEWSACRVAGSGGGVTYKGLGAKAVIDCSGAAGAGNPYFSRLPFALNKGEAIIAAIPGLPRNAVYKYAVLSIVPWGADRFWIGSTFDWDYTDSLPTAAFRAAAEGILRQWLRLPFTLENHFAAIRPATVTRDAFAGMHPLHPQVGILNGMGSKGCSLAPFLAHNLAGHLTKEEPLTAQVDVGRYARALSR